MSRCVLFDVPPLFLALKKEDLLDLSYILSCFVCAGGV